MVFFIRKYSFFYLPYSIILQKNLHGNYSVTCLVKLMYSILMLFDFYEGMMPKLIHHHSKEKIDWNNKYILYINNTYVDLPE